MAEAVQGYQIRTEIAMARYLARNAVKARWKAEGRKLHEFSGRDIAMAAEEYLRLRPELISLARAKLSTDAPKPKR